MPDNKSSFPWPRYWFPEGSSDYATFVQSGYLTLPSPEHSHYYPVVPSQLSDLTQIPVLILLGEPGYGKSQALTEEHNRLNSEQADDLVIFCDLKTFGPGDQQSLQHQLLDEEKFKLVEQGQRLWILLDGLDECTLHTPADWLIREFINKIDNPERIFVRITCRASSWPQLLEKSFLERWSSVTNAPVKMWRLCPLREEDVSTAAQLSQINETEFLSAIAERNVEELAALPVTLLFMLKLFQQNQLPRQRTDIFEKGLNLLCEDSPERRKAQKKSQVPADTRFLAAAKMALGYILQGCNGIWHGPRVDCPQGLFTAREICGTENYNDIQHTLDELAISETLELTGVFARLNLHRFQFASRTFAEFLAAWYISKSKVPTPQKLKLLLHPDSQRLIPDLHETAAWFAALDADFRTWLVNNEPEAALEADFATLAQVDLPALVDGLLSLAVEEQRPSYDWQRLAKLKYSDLEFKLSSVITDSSVPFAGRALAILIANACELKSLGKELAELALNDREDFELRKLATSYMVNMDDEARSRLTPIAESDQDLSLKAIALSVLRPRLMGSEAFFSQISPTFLETSSHDLRYIVDEGSFLDELDVDGLIVGLKWITKHAPIGYDRFTVNRLKSRLLLRAFDHLHEEGVVAAIVCTMKALRSHYESFFDGLERRKQQNPFDDADKRHIILTELISQIDLESVNDWIFSGEDCFRQEDCKWLFQKYDQEQSEEKRRLIAITINQLIQCAVNRDAVEEILSRAGLEVIDPDPILTEYMAWLIYPMDLSNQATVNSRKQYFERQASIRNNEQRKQAKSLPNQPNFYIQADLEACEAGDFNRWTNLIASLALEEDGSQKFPNDPDSLPGWKNADGTLRNRIVEAALNYLENSETPDETILLENSRTLVQAACGLAVAMLADTDNLQRLSNENLSRCCLVVVTHFFEPETQKQIFRKLRSIVPDAFDDAVLKKIDREAAGNLNLLYSCREIWHPGFLQHLADTRLNAKGWRFDSRLSLAELLLQNNIDNIVQQLVDWLKHETDPANQRSTAISLLRNAPVQAWDSIQWILTEDVEMARQIILTTAYSGGYSDTIYSDLKADQLGWLYDRIRDLFPEADDPNDNGQFHTVTPRHDAGRMRNNMIGLLVNMATSEAIKELDRICKSYPDSPWLIRAKADACKNLWRQERTQLSFAESIRLLTDPNSTVVRDSQELMVATKEALERFAHEALHGSPPLTVFLWNGNKTKTPVSEQKLSDFLKFYLDREWRGRRIIINREVEIRNWRDFGIGERTDILIQAHTPNGDSACVVIEVKVDKNVKPEDIPEQLVGKYLDSESRTCGIYLVGWFGKSRYMIESLRESADQYAVDNTTDKIKVNSLILDLSHPLQTGKEPHQAIG